MIRIGDAGPVEAQLLSGISDTDIERAIAGEATAFAQCFEHEAPLVVGVTRAPRRDGGGRGPYRDAGVRRAEPARDHAA